MFFFVTVSPLVMKEVAVFTEELEKNYRGK